MSNRSGKPPPVTPLRTDYQYPRTFQAGPDAERFRGYLFRSLRSGVCPSGYGRILKLASLSSETVLPAASRTTTLIRPFPTGVSAGIVQLKLRRVPASPSATTVVKVRPLSVDSNIS